jgi:hypothetical protein
MFSSLAHLSIIFSKCRRVQPLPGPAVNENMPLLPVPHIMQQHVAGVAGQLHGPGRTHDAAPSPAVVLALWYREGDLAGGAVPQLDPGLQNFSGSWSS